MLGLCFSGGGSKLYVRLLSTLRFSGEESKGSERFSLRCSGENSTGSDLLVVLGSVENSKGCDLVLLLPELAVAVVYFAGDLKGDEGRRRIERL